MADILIICNKLKYNCIQKNMVAYDYYSNSFACTCPVIDSVNIYIGAVVEESTRICALCVSGRTTH